ncbi:Uncharacterised protein [Vibrio cholerae]|uniref:Uncharacterized protein n=1 Tax=Vibrio cholerae TaxID=666 RepID=A0A655TWX7_VIBCL|nr:Uncharacterised protein [Vibrio cholerae]CSB40987.1 Uncharacterised protein [Vibrio cholerae]
MPISLINVTKSQMQKCKRYGLVYLQEKPKTQEHIQKGLLTLLLPWTRKTQSCLLIFVSLYGWLEVQPR